MSKLEWSQRSSPRPPWQRRPTPFALVILGVTFAVACGTPKEDPSRLVYLRTPVPARDSLQSEVLGPADLIANPWMIGSNGRIVVVSDLKPPYLHVLDARTGRHIKSFGAHGEGPGDFSGAPSLMRAGLQADTLWMLDGPRRRITGFAIAALESDTMAPRATTFQIDSVLAYTADGPGRSGLIVAMAQDWKEGLIPLRLHLGSPRADIGPPRSFSDSRFTPRYFGNAYLGRLCYSPKHQVTVQIFTFAGRIDLLDSTGVMTGSVAVPYPFRPDPYADTTAGKQIDFNPFGERVRWAYYDCAATDRFLYAIYDGRMVGGKAPNPVPVSEVQVFDWTGRVVRTVVLDHASTGISVPPGDSLLYSFAEDSGRFAVRRTRLRQR